MSKLIYPTIQRVVNWEPYTGSNKPSTGVLCKWKDGRVEPFDPRVHTVKDLLFVESDTPKRDDDIVRDDFCGVLSFF